MVFQAVSFTESECGSKIKGSKKRFCWTFKIDGVLNTIQLVSSFVSGKRKVLHNDREIYMEKELLNVKFEYTYKIDNHMIRLSQKQNKFQMVIDGLSFQKWQQKMGNWKEDKKSSFKEEKSSSDPFAQFGNMSKKTSSHQEHNAFGAFQDFSFPIKSQPKSTNNFSNKDSFDGVFGSTKQAISNTDIFGGFNEQPVSFTTQNPQSVKKPAETINLLDL